MVAQECTAAVAFVSAQILCAEWRAKRWPSKETVLKGVRRSWQQYHSKQPNSHVRGFSFLKNLALSELERTKASQYLAYNINNLGAHRNTDGRGTKGVPWISKTKDETQ